MPSNKIIFITVPIVILLIGGFFAYQYLLKPSIFGLDIVPVVTPTPDVDIIEETPTVTETPINATPTPTSTPFGQTTSPTPKPSNTPSQTPTPSTNPTPIPTPVPTQTPAPTPTPIPVDAASCAKFQPVPNINYCTHPQMPVDLVEQCQLCKLAGF